ncbi:hypothetical protein SAMN06265379_101956 [Saccharicrinis carchari]|uniref:Uncharacterized protein n=1 Tax=Saccharicrinis carchari TaxID=1168039 RepID=A0A521BI96_SACCC|nr:hypothetical protein SAMN06265379_101956 [Saccharicrinis carchari]
MKLYWNFIYYLIYKLNYKIHLIFKRINPVLLLYKTKHAKKRFKKRGISDPIKELDKYWKNPDIGLSEMYSSVWINMLCILFFMGLIRLVNLTLHNNMHVPFNGQLIASVILSLYTNYILLFRKKFYLICFKKFDKMNKTEHTTLFIKSVAIWLLFITIIVVSFFLTINFS